MTWKSRREIEVVYASAEIRKIFSDLFALRLMLRDRIIHPDYAPSQLYDKAIYLSPDGDAMLDRLSEKFKNIDHVNIKLALFIKFYHHNLFIDLDKTSADILEQAIHEDIVKNKALYPWVYDLSLYDKYYNTFTMNVSNLNYENTIKLLDSSSPGVFQIQDVIIGPFGVTKSSGQRKLFPTLTAPLWHCSNVACFNLHAVRLEPGDAPVKIATSALYEICNDEYGDPSEWYEFFEKTARIPAFFDDKNTEGVPWVLGNVFTEIEHKLIVTKAIELHSKEIRGVLDGNVIAQKLFKNSAAKIGQQLTKSQCFQIELILSDADLVKLIDTLIDDNSINIPATEVRQAHFSRIHNWLSIAWECSQYGLRPISVAHNLSIDRLKQLIQETYNSNDKGDSRERLDWLLRHVKGNSLSEKLNNFIYEENPETIIKTLLLHDKKVIQRAFDILKFGLFSLPFSAEGEDKLIKRMLWKLGFDIKIYPDNQRRFWDYHRKILNTLMQNSSYTETDKEQIRGAAANFYVALEEILDYSLSFITWALLSDHYAETKFNCTIDDARKHMANQLSNKAVTTGDDLIQFNADGVNTLYPLVLGFKLLSKICEELLAAKDSKHERPFHEFPNFHFHAKIEKFPFIHKLLLLDLREDERSVLLRTLFEITERLTAGKVCEIRNRISHKRPDHEFPKRNEIESSCKIIGDVITLMEDTGICPLIYHRIARNTDEYGRSKIIMKNYKGRTVLFYSPLQCSSSSLPSLGEPVIVVPSLHIGDSAEFIRFNYVENSEYVTAWQDYPKRRFVAFEKDTSERT